MFLDTVVFGTILSKSELQANYKD